MVASTSVWASVVREIGGDAVRAEAIITDPAIDPHSYESTPRDAAEAGDADLVIVNGGGYDEFMEQIVDGRGEGEPAIKAVDVVGARSAPAGETGHQQSGHVEHGGEPGLQQPGHAEPVHEPDPGHGQGEHEHDHSINEHVWYDLTATQRMAGAIADELGRLQPHDAERFHRSAAKFNEQLDRMRARVDRIAGANHGKQVIVTEPVAHYLIEAARLIDITPQSFVQAVESENDPPAAAVAEVQTAVDSRRASAVIFNPQTETPMTRQVKTRAERNRTPVVEMRDTLPRGRTYLQWMNDQITALDASLERNR
ncbi:metal ABC transporter solute-binding protein, Zn/Mn family [Saccharopolyspora griseoalba]|uniref:Metal ABC transporter solute-binding protein, Zn/Mn family n=1 Tax=Saccharopolyspora griseoalba TaxID=1431848 RepID=A0ABW2LE02_9PSEU